MKHDATLATAFQALSHPNRAKLFRILVNDPQAGASYTALGRAARMTDATLTHHLRVMEKCGLIRRRRKGVFQTYRIDPNRLITALVQVEGMVRLSRRVGPSP